MALTDTLIRQAKPAATPIKLTDEKGLHLLINPNGSRYWRFNYRINGKQKTLALGTYPDTSLKMARIFRDEARQLIANGTDPAELRKSEKVAVTEARREQSEADMIERMIQAGEPLPDSFEAMAREWFTQFEPEWTNKKIIWPPAYCLPLGERGIEGDLLGGVALYPPNPKT